MTTPEPFPDVEDLLCDFFDDLAETATRSDINLQQKLPLIVVVRRGGPTGRYNDEPRLDIDTFAPTRAQARELAVAVQQRLIPGPVRLDGAVLDRVTNPSGPFELPYADDTVRRFTASYGAVLRRPR